MRKIVLLIMALALVAALAYFLLRKSTPLPVLAPEIAKVAPKEKPVSFEDDFRPHRPSSTQHIKPHDSRFIEDEKYAQPYLEHSHIKDEFHYDADDIYGYIEERDHYASPHEHDEYLRLYDEMAEDELYWDYQRMLYDEMQREELGELNDIYSDYDVERYREAEMESLRHEYDDHYFPDESEWKRTPKEKKDALKKLAGKDSKDKDKLNRLNEATKNQTPEQLKKAAQKLSSPVVAKANAIKDKVIAKALNKVKKVAGQPEEDIALFQIKKGEKKIFVYAIRDTQTFEETLPSSLRKKVLKADILIEQDAQDDLKTHFDSDKKHIIPLDAADAIEKVEQELEDHKDKKIAIAVRESRIYGEKGLLNLFGHEDYSIMYYNDDRELVKYPPHAKRE